MWTRSFKSALLLILVIASLIALVVPFLFLGSSLVIPPPKVIASLDLVVDSSSDNLCYDHVILVTIDGCRPDKLLEANTPHIDEIVRDAAYSWSAQTVYPSRTTEAHASLFTGAPPEVHQYTYSGDNVEAETIFQVFEKASYKTAFISGKGGPDGGRIAGLEVGVSYVKNDVDYRSLDAVTYEPGSEDPNGDIRVMENAIQIFVENRPTLMFVLLPLVDYTGHIYGHTSSEYLQAIEKADQAIGMLVDNLRGLGIYKDTLLIIVSDHGMTGTSHGSLDPGDMTIPLILQRPGIPIGDIGEVSITDVAPTVTSLVGLRAPENSKGNVIYKILEALIPRAPIYIEGDENFTPANGVTSGSGTENDPYIIKGWDISTENASGIEIRNTTAYFIVRRCRVYGGKDNGFDGIRFENVVNGRIDNVRTDNNYRGINLLSSNNNIIVNSTVENNTYGIRLIDSDNNRIYHNNIINNDNQAHDEGSNFWDNGYPSGGNYWSDYAGEDNYWGENQDILGSDGIGDTPYNIPSGANQDRYSFMNPARRGVEVLISPNYRSVPPRVTLTYTVTVTNTGNVVDNYTLSVGDNSNWGPSVSPESLIVLPSASDNAALSVTVLENATPGTVDNITVTVTSQMDNTVIDNDFCIAYVLSPKAELGLATLYEVGLDVNLYLGEGSRLVVKFYTWAGPFQAENVVWSGVTPAHVVLLVNISHPENTVVENSVLVVTDNMGNVISTVASFTVTQDVLFGRIMEIKGEWPLLGADQDALFQEIMDIKGVWPIAPS
jgi:parallel beta-helix repeat protein